MAVSTGYLTKIRNAVRCSSGTDVNAELTDIIEECRLDLISKGVTSAMANSETDQLILGAVRSFARWKFGLSNPDAAANKADYEDQCDELRRKRDYAYLTITFAVTDESDVAIEDADITFNGETKYTDANGSAVFYYVSEGQRQYYTINASGYVSENDYVDVTASATVTVELGAA